MGRILITGGAGFLGYHLAKHLVSRDYSVCLVDNYSRGILDSSLDLLLRQSQVSFTKTDLLDQNAVFELGTDFDGIFHLGAIVGVQNVVKRPFDVLVGNIRMFEHVIALANRQSKLSRLLFASTSEVYAGTLINFGLTIPTPEASALAITSLNMSRTSYMLSKITGEAMCQVSGLPFTIFRPHNIYGPRMGMSHVIPEQLKNAFQANSGDRLDVSSAEHTRSFCYIDDAVELLTRMLEVPSSIGKTLNVGTEQPEVKMHEVVEICIAVTGKNLGINVMPPMLGSPERRAPNMQLSTSVLGYASEVDLKEGIFRTWEWYREHVFESKESTAR